MARLSSLRVVAIALPIAVAGLFACRVDHDDPRSVEATGHTTQALWEAIDGTCLGGTLLPPGDDVTSNDVNGGQPVPLPFQANYFGTKFSSLVVSNNGLVSFDGSFVATKNPRNLNNTSSPIIAPYWLDVDTSPKTVPVPTEAGADGGTRIVQYGTVAYCSFLFTSETGDRQPAFSAIWSDVRASNGTIGNTFQVILVDRSLAGEPGDFDIVFNYGTIQWDSAVGNVFGRAGYAAAPVTGRYELPSSGVQNALLDSSPTGLAVTQTSSTIVGRHVFPVRALGVGTGVITGHVTDSVTGVGLANAKIDACPSGGTTCITAYTNGLGEYTIGGLSPKSFAVTATAADNHFPKSVFNVDVSSNTVVVDFPLQAPPPPPPPPPPGAPPPSILPPGTTIPSATINPSTGIPSQYWASPMTVVTHGCAGGSAGYSIRGVNASTGQPVTLTGPMFESSAGTYTATIAPFYPVVHGAATVDLRITCADGTFTTASFPIYIDPSGNVFDTDGNPVPGATVTLFSVDPVSGAETIVPDGSVVMSPGNRRNPDLTDAAGFFGWDTTAGYYRVSARKDGCFSADSANPSAAAYTSILQVTIGHPVTGLVLTLSCPNVGIVDALNALLPTGDSFTDGKIRDAISTLTSVDGANPYANDSSVVAKLLTIKTPASAVASVATIIQRIVERDRAAAEAEIARAIQFAGSAPKIAQAQRAYADGLDLTTKGRYGAAVDNFVDAWTKARDAMTKR